MSELVVTRADDGGTFRRAPGELVVVRLTEIPTSGYRWQVNAGDGLDLVSSEYVHSATAEVGGGGTRIVTLRALRPSTAQVELVLKQPWESDDSAADRVLITLEVIPSSV
ncbi:MAG TPA: protease inhibitor I42 family protein [Streptosporangiaceae bacterium]|nr:protease inhibitor I42 family protein [Streptosporangiaceae bacterium]